MAAGAIIAGLGATPAQAQLRISQVYGAGGNLGAVYARDFVELHNPTAAPVALGGWSLQYAADTSPSWSSKPLSGSIPPGGYYLVGAASGTALASGQVLELPATDATSTLPLGAAAGKLALCNSTALLAGIAPTSPAIVDFVGYGTTAGWREPFVGGALADNAPAPSAARAIVRSNCGARDTNRNATDFSVAFPSPRNSASPAAGGLNPIGMAFPHLVEAGFRTHLRISIAECATLAPAAGVSATIDLSALGGMAAQPLYDDGTQGDEMAGDGLFSFEATVALGTPAGALDLPLFVQAGALTGAASIGLVVVPAATPDHDSCPRALAVPGPYGFGVDVPFDLTDANVEANPIVSLSTAPLSGMANRRGLWFSVVGNGQVMSASLCANSEDTALIVMGGSCDGLSVVANGDDSGPACAGAAASAAWCSTAGETYYVWIAEFHGAASTLQGLLRIRDDGGPCGGATSLALCTLQAPVGAVDEGEAFFGPGVNDGCDNSSQRFVDLNVGYPAVGVRGTTRAIGDARDGDWYRFQAPTTDTLTASITAQCSVTLNLYALSANGACPAFPLASSPSSARCASAGLAFGVVAGQWYALRVIEAPTPAAFGGVLPGGKTAAYVGQFAIGGPPANDACAGATPLVLGGAEAIGNLGAATPDGSSVCDSGTPDLWYRVVLPAAGTLRADTCGSSTDTVLSLFDACGGNELACNDDDPSLVCASGASRLSVAGLAPGAYWLRVSDKGLAGSFRVRASFALDNDDCSNAVTLTLPSQHVGTFGFAQPESPQVPFCAGPLPGQAQNFVATAGVWYRFVADADETIRIDTLASATDTKLWVYDASAGCAALSCVTANDDIQGSPFQSKLAFRARAGIEYRLLVGPFSNGQPESEFLLTLRREPTPANDECSLATVLSTPSGSVAGTTVGATGETNTSSNSMPSCTPGTSVFDVWYSFTASCSGIHEFSTCGALDTLLSVHDACPGPATSMQVPPLTDSCNQDGPSGCAPGSELALHLDAGGTYLVRVANAYGAQAEGTFTLEWRSPDLDGDGAPDCLDGCPLDPAKLAPGVCGCGVSDVDSDGDGVPDCLDGCPDDPAKKASGICGCGVPDVDSDFDGVFDCFDGCPLDPLKLAPGACGCGLPDIDSDGDGVPDCIDGCPLDPAKVDPGFCGCGVPEFDADGDLVPDCVDNCPAYPNPLQEDCDDDGVGDVCEIQGGGSSDCDSNGVPDECDPDCNLNARPDACDLLAGSSVDLNSNGVPDECENLLGMAFCFGDGSGSACPCNNFGAAGEGCANSTGAGGRLTNVGGNSVAADDAQIAAIQLPPSKPGLVLMGDLTLGGGLGTPLRDGLLCLQPSKRLPAGGTSPGGALSLGQLVAASGGLIQPGSTHYFQVWTRDGNASPCGGKANLSNALRITFAP